MKHKHPMTRALALLLSAALALSAVPITAQAADVGESGPFTVTLNGGTQLETRVLATEQSCEYWWSNAATFIQVKVPAGTAADATVSFSSDTVDVPGGYFARSEEEDCESGENLPLLTGEEFYCFGSYWDDPYHFYFVSEADWDAGTPSDPQPAERAVTLKYINSKFSVYTQLAFTLENEAGETVALGDLNTSNPYIPYYQPTLTDGRYTLSARDGETLLGSYTFTTSSKRKELSFAPLTVTSNAGFRAGTDFDACLTRGDDVAGASVTAEGTFLFLIDEPNIDFALTVTPSAEKLTQGYTAATATDLYLTANTGTKNLACNAPTTLTGITLAEDSAQIAQNRTYQLAPTLTPEAVQGVTITYEKGEGGDNFTLSDTGLITPTAESSGNTVVIRATKGETTLTKVFTFDVTAPVAVTYPSYENRVYDDFENDLWLQYDFRELNVGDTATIYPWRVPQAISDSTQNDVERPNFNFEIVEGDSVSLSTCDSTTQTIVTAVKPGDTVVMVSYDAFVHTAGQSYAASSVVNTAYVVFSVGEEGCGVTELSTSISATSYDTYYYTGDHYDLPFTVTATGAETVEVTCNGQSVSAVDGAYTAALTNRSNIIGVRATDGRGKTRSYYKVVDARFVEVSVVNQADGSGTIGAGDTALIRFRGITMPVCKLATIYNPCYSSEEYGYKATSVHYTNPDLGEVRGYCNQWDLATNNTIEVTFPAAGDYAFSAGQINAQWWGDALGSDKTKTGVDNANVNATLRTGEFSRLPDFTVSVAGDSQVTHPTGISLNETERTLEVGDTLSLTANVLPTGATNRAVTWTLTDAATGAGESFYARISADGTVTALNPTPAGTALRATATTVDGGLTASCTITVAGEQVTPGAGQVTLSVDTYTIGGTALVYDTGVTVEDGQSVWEVTRALLEAQNISYTSGGGNSVYVSEIGGVSEFDYGAGSGWMYSVNGVYPEAACSNYTLRAGDVIRWRYTTDLGNDLGLQRPGAASDDAGISSVTVNGTGAVGDGQLWSVTLPYGAALPTQPAALCVTPVNPDSTVTAVQTADNGATWSFTVIAADRVTTCTYTLRVSVAQQSADVSALTLATGQYLSGLGTPGVGAIGGEWMAIGLLRGKVAAAGSWTDAYYANAAAYVGETINAAGQLHRVKATENARLILALTALGRDPTNVGGKNLLTALADLDYVGGQGVNGPIWTLIALDSHCYEMPALTGAGTQTTRENLISTILNAQLPDGGWALSGTQADPDMTAMALQALAPYYGVQGAVTTAVNRGLGTLSDLQNASGGFGSLGIANCESCAQVVVALSALGVNPDTDSRFLKNGVSALDALCLYGVSGGGFSHTAGGARDGMATEQGYLALVAYERLLAGSGRLYDMTGVEISDPVGAVIALIDGIGTVTLDRAAVIGAARTAYDALTAAQQAQVTNYALLTAAESRLAELKNAQTPQSPQAEGDTKTLDGEKTTLVIDGVTYVVSLPAADVMRAIAALAGAQQPETEAVVRAYLAYAALDDTDKAQVYNYAALTAQMERIGTENHLDTATGICAEGLDWNIRLVVERLEAGKTYDLVSGSIGQNEVIGLWHFRFVDVLTGADCQPVGAVSLRIPDLALADFDQLRIACVTGDGRVEYLDCGVEDGWVVLEAPEYADYAVIGSRAATLMTLDQGTDVVGAAADGASGESQNTLLWLWCGLGSVGAVALVIALVLRRRKNTPEN